MTNENATNTRPLKHLDRKCKNALFLGFPRDIFQRVSCFFSKHYSAMLSAFEIFSTEKQGTFLPLRGVRREYGNLKVKTISLRSSYDEQFHFKPKSRYFYSQCDYLLIKFWVYFRHHSQKKTNPVLSEVPYFLDNMVVRISGRKEFNLHKFF